VTPAELLDELHREFRKGGINEVAIHSRTEVVYGFQHGSQVYINPRPAVVETLLHELTHRRYPRWGEARVRKESARLLASLSDADVGRWYRRYQRAARKHRRPVRLED
jgi:hypothetical protein